MLDNSVLDLVLVDSLLDSLELTNSLLDLLDSEPDFLFDKLLKNIILVTIGFPFVMVPVLSNITLVNR